MILYLLIAIVAGMRSSFRFMLWLSILHTSRQSKQLPSGCSRVHPD